MKTSYTNISPYKKSFIIILLSVATLCAYAKGSQSDKNYEDYLMQAQNKLSTGKYDEANEILETLTICKSDSLYADYYYLHGIVNEHRGDSDKAVRYFAKCMELSEKGSNRDLSYLDAASRCINHYVERHNWRQVIRYSRRALMTPDSIQRRYPNTYIIYEWYANALNHLWKYSKVVEIADKGQPFVSAVFSPNESGYYDLYILRIVALLIMNKWDMVRNAIDEIDEINNQYGGVISNTLAALNTQFKQAKAAMSWRNDANERIIQINNYANSLLLQPPTSDSGKKVWTDLFDMIIRQLELFYFDINNPADEKYWSRLLAYAITYFNAVCDEMPEREKLAYDLVLLRKNFLDYHSGQLHKTPKRWTDIRNSLNSDELAIEITVSPDEILILGHDFTSPISVRIPEHIMTEIEKYDYKDISIVNDYYNAKSPLIQLIDLIKPYLTGYKTIYLSVTNTFAQHNYGAIPYFEKRLDDIYDIVQMTTTADIDSYKSKNKKVNVAEQVLFGGIDYDNTAENNQPAQNGTPEIGVALSDTRSGFGYLPYSLMEVNKIKDIFPEATLYSGTSASESHFKSLNMADKPLLLHVATHGFTLSTSNKGNDNASNILSIRLRTGLLMAGGNRSIKGLHSEGDDGILTSQEIAELDMEGVELAVLSSCASGMGDLTNTNGVVYGVANAMKSAGVKRLVVTLWDIPDEASALAMRQFYKNISEGKSPRRSLKCMRQYMIERGYIDPFYWAAFVCID